MEAFVPTEYNNIALDADGFIYATIGTFDNNSSGSTDPVRRLNAKGNDILIRNGYYDPRGDIQYGSGGGYTGPSKFVDVAVLENECYYCLDNNRGRIFGYDFQGNMLYAFGGIGYREGSFKNPVAIEDLGDSLLILDKELGTITQMTLTEYGTLINDALNTYKKGEYDESAAYWEKVLKLNGNYDLAYIGIGRALLRQDRYEEAMNYFKLKLDYKNYSKAYKLYRKEWVEDNIGYIFAVFIAWLLFIFIKNTVKRIRREVNEE
jgi:tetratricopeptide (TPR) repeat protein